MESDLLQISIAEYQELLEEIRSGRESVWLAMGVYLALTGALLGILKPDSFATVPAPFLMVAFGLLVAAHIYRIRRDNNVNYARVWDIETSWKKAACSEGVGARWNPWDSPKLEARWRPARPVWSFRLRKARLPRKRLGTIDFGLITLDGLVVDLWLLYALAVHVGAVTFNEAWFVLYILIAAGTWELIAAVWLEVTRHERAVIEKWKTDNPQTPAQTESTLKTGKDTGGQQLPAEGKDGR